MKVNPRKLKVSGLPSPRRLRLAAAKRPNSISLVLSGCSDSENSFSRARMISREASGLGLVLESDDEIVGIAHDDHVARGVTPSPALGPEIEDVVQVDVGKKRRCHRPLPGPLVTNRHDSVFKDARPEPLLDQADHARIADPVLHEADQPV